jgi:hypothetical protein
MKRYVKSPVKKGVHDSKAQKNELQRMRGLLLRKNGMTEATEIPTIGVATPTRQIHSARPMGRMLVPTGTGQRAKRTVKKL